MLVIFVAVILPDTYIYAASETTLSGESSDLSRQYSARLLWSDGKAEIVLQISNDEAVATHLLQGELDNSTEGLLTGDLSSLEGIRYGTLSLEKSIHTHTIEWSGTLTAEKTYLITLERFKNEDNDWDPDYPLVVTRDYLRDDYNFNIPRELFLNARPKFKRFGDAISLLDREFPYWRSGGLNFSYLLDGNFLIDYGRTDIGMLGDVVLKLRDTELFEYVDLSIGEYDGSFPEQVKFSRSFYKFKTGRELLSIFTSLSNKISTEYFCADACKPVPMSGKSQNVMLFEIVGTSEKLHFKRPKFWEKYVLSLTLYTDAVKEQQQHANGEDGIFIIQFQIVAGNMAPSGNGQVPPDSRFKEHPIDLADLNTLSSKLQMRIADDLGGTYGEESD